MNNEKLIVALDVPDLKEAEALVKLLSPVVGVFKVGKELFTAEGPRVVEMVHAHKAQVFLDLKFHDIPNTVAQACRAAVRHKIFMLNIHAFGGKTMVSKAVEAVREEAQKLNQSLPILIGVTVLTSLEDKDLSEVGVLNPVSKQVELLARLAKDAGLSGVVASPKEIDLVRKACGKDFMIVTPGVRPEWAAVGDQKRVMTPREAIQKGADFIVVGRPITQDKDPKAATEKILKEING